MKPHKHAELIELAAQAIGIEGEWVKDPAYVNERWYYSVPYTNQNMMSSYEWNPLRENGDALHLAITLQMEIYHGYDEAGAVYASYTKPNSAIAYCVEYYDDITHMGDKYSATRMAIVRAASELGKLKSAEVLK